MPGQFTPDNIVILFILSSTALSPLTLSLPSPSLSQAFSCHPPVSARPTLKGEDPLKDS